MNCPVCGEPERESQFFPKSFCSWLCWAKTLCVRAREAHEVARIAREKRIAYLKRWLEHYERTGQPLPLDPPDPLGLSRPNLIFSTYS